MLTRFDMTISPMNSPYYVECSTVYFSTKEAAQKAADWMNEHR